MPEQNIRFLTSVEKMSSLGKHSRDDERMEGDPNAFISVLVNGNCFQVKLLERLLSMRWVLMPCVVLVPRRIRPQEQHWRQRSCHGIDSRHRRMAPQMEF